MELAEKVAALSIGKDKLYARQAIKLTDAELVQAIEQKLILHRNQFGIEEFWVDSMPHMQATHFSRKRTQAVTVSAPVPEVKEVVAPPKVKKAAPAKKQGQPVLDGPGLFG